MNRQRAKELLPIIQAFADGKEIQFKASSGRWLQVSDPAFNSYENYEYRIKPEPMVIYARIDTNGNVHASKERDDFYKKSTGVRKFIEVIE